MATTASTGMAAQNYTGGTTVHHWCGIGDGRYADTALLAVIQHTETAKRIVDSDVLTIDEVGMLSATVFETVEYICRNIRQIDRVFGGLQVCC